VEGWNQTAWKSLLLPGAVLVAAAVAILESGWPALSASAVNSYYYVAFGTGIFLAWRFHSSRVLFTLLTLLLGHRAMEFFATGAGAAAGPGRTSFEVVSLLLPLNFIIFSELRERGFTIPALAPRLALLLAESVLVTILCRPEQSGPPAIFHFALLPRSWLAWTAIPQPALALFAAAFAFFGGRYSLYRKPAESGMFWSLAATALALHAKSGVGVISGAYMATAGLIISCSVIENFYMLAYHDELTSLPSRRAFNDALQRLEPPYTIAALDIDHFKSFNDTYGHEVGDQVLRMVAGKLARVSGGGRAFRVGGEEFSILFPGRSTKDVYADLDLLRAVVEQSMFSLRTAEERRSAARGPDRRTSKGARGQRTPVLAGGGSQELSVTISIGVAEARPGTADVNQVIRAADKALYQAKQSGRNRVEIADNPTPRARRSSKRSIA